jgi:type I restriction enzyme S subunit
MTAWENVALAALGRFASGRPIKPGLEGPYHAFGSNGVIGRSPVARHPSGVIVGRVGAYCGSVAVSREPFWASDNTIVIEPEIPTDLDYLYYLLLNANLNQHAGGAAQPLVTHGALKTLTFSVPDPSSRFRVGAILRSIDDLVENHRRRVELLEEMARAVYREWFVNFRYPDHEKANLVESAMGPIPEGWDVGRVDSHFVLQRGFDLPASQRQPGPVPIVGASGRQGFHSTAKAQGPGLTTGRSGTVGVVTYVPGDFWPLNTSLWVKEFRLSTPRSAYYLLSSLELMQAASGAAVPTLNRNVVHALPAVCPPRALIEHWDSAAEPIFHSMEVLRAHSERLADLRHHLLPKLVTGQIDVSLLDLEALVEDSVA